ncbi:hypothetical protein pb186bvf_019948 [Paramecium bursaria]
MINLNSHDTLTYYAIDRSNIAFINYSENKKFRQNLNLMMVVINFLIRIKKQKLLQFEELEKKNQVEFEPHYNIQLFSPIQKKKIRISDFLKDLFLGQLKCHLNKMGCIPQVSSKVFPNQKDNILTSRSEDVPIKKIVDKGNIKGNIKDKNPIPQVKKGNQVLNQRNKILAKGILEGLDKKVTELNEFIDEDQFKNQEKQTHQPKLELQRKLLLKSQYPATVKYQHIFILISPNILIYKVKYTQEVQKMNSFLLNLIELIQCKLEKYLMILQQIIIRWLWNLYGKKYSQGWIILGIRGNVWIRLIHQLLKPQIRIIQGMEIKWLWSSLHLRCEKVKILQGIV